MFGLSKKSSIIIAIVISTVAVLGALVWIFFPVILKTLSPTRYTQYALTETGKAVSAELAEIDSFFGLPDLSEAEVKHLAAELDGISASLVYDRWNAPDIDLSKLNIGIDLLYGREAKQASLDLRTDWGERSFLITLFTNAEQIALGLNDSAGWVANANTIGKELSGLGLPVDEDLELDPGVLFPDAGSNEVKEETLLILKDFIKTLKFDREKDSDYFTGYSGTVMTAVINGSDLKSFFLDTIDIAYGQSAIADKLRRSVSGLDTSNHKLSVLISDKHIIQAARIIVSAAPDSDIVITAHLPDTVNMLDHILIDVTIKNNNNRRVYSLESKGRHVPADGIFTDTTTITGFDTGEIRLDSELHEDGVLSFTAQFGATVLDAKGKWNTDDESLSLTLHEFNMETLGSVELQLSGELNITVGKAVSDIRDITIGAKDIADFDIFELYTLFTIIWDVIRQDKTLFELVGEPLIDLVLTTVLGEETGALVKDLFGSNIDAIMDMLVDLLDSAVSGITDTLGSFIDDMLENLGDLISGWFSGFP